MAFSHRPVLLNEAVNGLNIRPDGFYVDGTLGGAGHSLEIVKKLTTGRLIGIDQDEDAIRAATERLAPYADRVTVVRSNFEDIRRILAASEHTRRATLDLDEVVFCKPGEAAERQPAFPWNLIYKQPMRLGFPALTQFLQRRGYDVWVYSTEYHSQDEVEQYLRHHQVRVTGIVTGAARKVSRGIRKEMEALISGHYPETVHIDGQSVVRTRSGEKAFEEYALSGDAESWSREVMEAFESFAGKAKKPS